MNQEDYFDPWEELDAELSDSMPLYATPTDADAPPEFAMPYDYGEPERSVNENQPYTTKPDVMPFYADQMEAMPIYATPTHTSIMPEWVIVRKDGRNKVDEWLFMLWFAREHDVRYINYQFYLGSEKTEVGFVEQKVLFEIKLQYADVTAQKIHNIIKLLANYCTCKLDPPNPDAIYFKNCTLVLENRAGEGIVLRKTPSTYVSLCRVPHNFNPAAGEPTRLLSFLNQLFQPEDLCAVQEYLGYCLMPSTKAQKAFFIIGKGGEGKSRLTVLMQKVLGNASIVSSISQIGKQFFGVMLQDCLLFMDDDLQTAKFNATDAFKSLVSNEANIVVEPKGKPHFEIRPYARFLLMGNQSVGSLHDKSHGFYRRVHIIKTKPCDPKRAHNPNIIQDIWAAEKDAILLWLVKGALRLARQNYQFTESESTKQALKSLKEEDNTALCFLQEQNFLYGEDYSITTGQLNGKYKEWCYDNDLFKVSGHQFKRTCEAFFAPYGAVYSNGVKTYNGRVRGFVGVQCTR